MNDKQKNRKIDNKNNDKQNISEKLQNKNENKQINDKKVENEIKDNKQEKADKKGNKKNFIIIAVVIIVVLILIDIILTIKTISSQENTVKENTIVETQNIIENRIETTEEIIYTEFSMNNYNFKINSKYKVDMQNDILTIQNNNEKAVVTINAGTMEEIQNNVELLTIPIEENGANIVKNPELQNINGKDVYVLEYSIDEKNYTIAYTGLDEENVIDMLTESASSLEVLVELANNCTKME